MAVVSFTLFLLLFAIIGVLASLKSRKNVEDYFLASRSIPAWLAGLSAVATNNSGYMFIGMIGYTYSDGLKTIWLMLGWILGDFFATQVCLPKMVFAAHKNNDHSLGCLLGNWLGANSLPLVKKLSGILTVILLSFYAAQQFKAGGIALKAILGWEMQFGIIIGGIIVVLYCFSGGIRASIWTDVVQSFVMLFGMAAMLIFGYLKVSGSNVVLSFPQNYFNWFPDGFWASFLFIAGWVFGGMGAISQPHIVTRFLTLSSSTGVQKMRLFYYIWFFLFYALTIGVGLLCRYLIPSQGNFLPETALPTLATILFNGFGSGLILAAIFAATISTADSLVLACSASLEGEVLSKRKSSKSLKRVKTFTLIFMLGAVSIAIYNPKDVFKHVLISWGLLTSAFSALIFLRCFSRQFKPIGSLVTIFSGITVFMVLHYKDSISTLPSFLKNMPYTYEPFPSVLTSLIIGFFFSKKLEK